MSKNILRFLLPSLVGVLVFLTPISWDGRLTIGIGIITGWIKSLMGDYGLSIVVLLTVVTSILTLLGTTFRVAWIQRRVHLRELFDVPLAGAREKIPEQKADSKSLLIEAWKRATQRASSWRACPSLN
jgi:hypothetical protein